ncbi:MAG: TIGR01457 family HAD-type hydrolase [Lactobacillus sp.]|jgi:4-nitrophenyl phosphatase|nr:TIGR01457 family HAD-type hydrolase [Lactobacillus sp.]MCI1973758.1 TIGR01457 family HAD-type hydrolase [Lactobacillus sp.]
MKQYQSFLIDLDGTVYRGRETIDAGVRFVKRLQKAGRDYVFLTNNTTRTRQMVVDKLAGHGIKTDVDHIYTPSLASVAYLRSLEPDQDKIPVYIIGQTGLFRAFAQDPNFYIDDQKPRYVIVGMDTDLTYHKIMVATNAIRNGAKFIGTNADVVLPAGHSFYPGNGSQCAMIAVASGQKPLFIGKPEKIIIDMALKRYNLERENCLLVGDNYDTDIKAGFNSQMDTLLVLTGVTQEQDLIGRKQPTYLVHSLDEWSL